MFPAQLLKRDTLIKSRYDGKDGSKGNKPSSRNHQGSADHQVALPFSIPMISAVSAQQHADVDHDKAEDGPQ
jgi:hypothetical protein